MTDQNLDTPSPRPEEQAQDDHQLIPSDQAAHVLTSFTQFLTICIHNILYYRSIYPTRTFISSRAYNLPVHQSRHPKLCSWIHDAVDAVQAQLAAGVVERIAVVIYDKHARVMERWMFDVASFPVWPDLDETEGLGAEEGENYDDDEGGEGEKGEGDLGDEDEGDVDKREDEQEDVEEEEDDEDEDGDKNEEAGGGEDDELDEEADDAESSTESVVNWANVDEQLRATVRKLAYAGEKMGPLPEGCTFTVAVELRDGGEAPISVSVSFYQFSWHQVVVTRKS